MEQGFDHQMFLKEPLNFEIRYNQINLDKKLEVLKDMVE
jgi:hypothetical protein